MTMSGGHKWERPDLGICFEVNRLRRERHELIGELTVRCELPGARQVNGALSIGDMNFSSVQARSTRAKLLASRAKTKEEVDWFGLLEQFTQGVISKEREGDPATNIWDIPVTEKLDDFSIHGIALPRTHPAILFGDGGSAKSYLLLYMLGRLALQGVPVALFDWELSGEEHLERMKLMFSERPSITYCRCSGPITSEIDRIERVVRDHGILYAGFDSISFAVSGPPESAETAIDYQQCVRRLTIGSLHIAHMNKSEDGDKKPFGSAFWFNLARSIWFVKAAESAQPGRLELGFFHRKANLGPLRRPVALTVHFEQQCTLFELASISDTDELVEKLSVRQKIYELLGRGSLTITEIAERLDEKVDTVRKAVKRGQQFVVIQGGTGEQDRVGRRASA